MRRGARECLGSVLVEFGQFADAEAAFRESIRLNPDLADAHRDLADLLMQGGHVDEAIRQSQEALARDSRSADARNNLGVALARAGRVAEAAEQFKAALKLQPDLVDARANLERLLGTGKTARPLRPPVMKVRQFTRDNACVGARDKIERCLGVALFSAS